MAVDAQLQFVPKMGKRLYQIIVLTDSNYHLRYI